MRLCPTYNPTVQNLELVGKIINLIDSESENWEIQTDLRAGKSFVRGTVWIPPDLSSQITTDVERHLMAEAFLCGWLLELSPKPIIWRDDMQRCAYLTSR